MSDAARELASALDEALPGLRALGEQQAGAPRGPGKWTRKDILGHLIDSALNNLQRFVRAQLEQPLVLASYDGHGWVATERPGARPWSDLLALWEALNRHVTHVMTGVPESRLANECVIGESQPVTLGWLMSDYVRHLRHHLEQILD
jgi:hypothetical protein